MIYIYYRGVNKGLFIIMMCNSRGVPCGDEASHVHILIDSYYCSEIRTLIVF